MKIVCQEFLDKGVIEKERVVFRANEDDDLGSYLFFKSVRTGEKTMSSKVNYPYWFPDRTVKANDYIIVYTGSGTNTERKNKDGTTSYFFYLGLSSPLWNKNEDAAVLMQAGEWLFQSVGPSTVNKQAVG